VSRRKLLTSGHDPEDRGLDRLGNLPGDCARVRGGARATMDLGLAARTSVPGDAARLVRVVGGLLIAAGVAGLLHSFLRFALQGVGTLAPVFPTRHLIITGFYRYVRNPMYVSVVSAILGQGLVLGNMWLLKYSGLVWLLFHLFVLGYEEPTLRDTFGSEYEAFCTGVPRWIPRLTPWRVS